MSAVKKTVSKKSSKPVSVTSVKSGGVVKSKSYSDMDELMEDNPDLSEDLKDPSIGKSISDFNDIGNDFDDDSDDISTVVPGYGRMNF